MDWQDHLREFEKMRDSTHAPQRQPRSSSASRNQRFAGGSGSSNSEGRYAGGGSVPQSRRRQMQDTAQGFTREDLRSIAAKGRGGDTMLAKIGPRTASLLDDLIHGGHKQVNPRTGLREYVKKDKKEVTSYKQKTSSNAKRTNEHHAEIGKQPKKKAKKPMDKGVTERMANMNLSPDRKATFSTKTKALDKGTEIKKPTKSEKIAEAPTIKQDKELLHRGMSIQNVKNLQDNFKGKSIPIFKAQQPNGMASIQSHIGNDSSDSRYISFEKDGMAMSAGKYAHKPVEFVRNKEGKVKGKPLFLKKDKDTGYLKTDKSYSKANQEKFEELKENNPNKEYGQIGYVGSVPKKNGNFIDLSSKEAIEQHNKNNPNDPLKGAIPQSRAIGDKEVLLYPGEEGIPIKNVNLIQKVQKVDEEYYKKHKSHQTPQKSLGRFRPKGSDNTTHFKIQISKKYNPNSNHAYDKLSNNSGRSGSMSSIPSMFSIPSDIESE